MLVITRRINESIIIDTGKDKIEIILKDIRGKGARIGIIADKRVSVLREELNRNQESGKES
jgi:carbon storage regulator CsrA